MAIHLYKTSTPSTRKGAVDSQVKSNPRNNLIYGQHRCGKGRNARGIITAGHRGGGHKRLYRKIDFRRNEKTYTNYTIYIRSIRIDIIIYIQKAVCFGRSLYSLGRVLIDQKEESTSTDMPLGTAIHNIEITLGKGGQLARAAGAVAKLIAKEGKSATLKLPSGELLIEPRRIEELQRNIQKELNYVNRKLNIAITRIANPYGHPNILAEFIAGQLKNRVSFRKAMKKAIELTEQAGTKGIQVQIAGRIDGKEIARVEWIREGRVPLQTIRAKIDYCSYTVRTIYGVLGIKIWIFAEEE
ncbi:hypothetical protein FNV43_RR05865 [Rhamnella rubrinervis]|uniref:Small ribosomal subunit protein uS3c n=1 Tax=Rhamnella rubrinervis TaxID=2594499 RepID=A0A8K0HC10_9ROSA|nr:hypothetical protein FNV43_RR05865 [Rhamnella rubrinervis]